MSGARDYQPAPNSEHWHQTFSAINQSINQSINQLKLTSLNVIFRFAESRQNVEEKERGK